MGWLAALIAFVLVASASVPASSRAAFGLERFDLAALGAGGFSSTQAGSHPFAVDISMAVHTSGEAPDGRLRTVTLYLPPGLLLNPLAVPRCSEAVFFDAGQTCPASTAVGTTSSTVVEPGNSQMSLVYSLVAPAGVSLRLGFRVGGAPVAMDVGVSTEPPYEMVATLADWPETVAVFATELNLWGVPAAKEHDAQRGSPVPIPESPFTTLPTSCEGPQRTYFEALSWEGDEDFGFAVTHDQADPPDPIGFTGCGKLSFGPEIDAAPTTEAASSPSGFDFSLGFFDEGLASPAGVAQSQARDVVLRLPSGLTVDENNLAALPLCSLADLEAEGLEAEAGEGCPEGSEVGTVEVTSPPLEEPLAGIVFAGEPEIGEEVEPIVDLILVVKDPGLGILVEQIVEVEEDPESGDIFVVAEGLPQLPIGELRVHLDGGPGGLLRTPPFCASYDGVDDHPEPIRALLNPWSDNGSLIAASSFAITTGPGGSPCPSIGGGAPAPGSGASPPPAVGPSAVVPDTKAFGGVRGKRRSLALFRFRSTESDSTFRCSLDRRPYRGCRSPLRLHGLPSGRHLLRVFAIDSSGSRDPSPAVVGFRIGLGHASGAAPARVRRR